MVLFRIRQINSFYQYRYNKGCGLDVIGCGTRSVVRDDRSLSHSILRGRFGSGIEICKEAYLCLILD